VAESAALSATCNSSLWLRVRCLAYSATGRLQLLGIIRIFCFIAETRDCLHNWFRTGSAFSANGSVEFMKECFAKLPKRVWKVFVRADSAFFDGALLDLLESKGCQYLIKVKLIGVKIK
jgi:hypothetical protein